MPLLLRLCLLLLLRPFIFVDALAQILPSRLQQNTIVAGRFNARCDVSHKFSYIHIAAFLSRLLRRLLLLLMVYLYNF